MRMKMRPAMGIATALAIAAVAGGAVLTQTGKACAAKQPTSFAEDVLPIFRGRCFSCHQPGGEGYEKSGLDLTTYQGIMKGTKFGPMVISGDPQRVSA